MQNEITQKTALLDERGRLIQQGYARQLILEYNPENLSVGPFGIFNRLRLKEWDYYGITTKDFFFSATVANIGYAGNVFVYWIDFNKKTMTERPVITPLGKGCVLPRTSESGDIRFSSAGVDIAFLRGHERRELNVFWKDFSEGKDLSAKLLLRQPQRDDTIVMVTPIGRKNFYYNQKINCMPVEGSINVGGKTHILKPDRALATLDWGRGVWDYSSFWNWASASGYLSDGRTVGLNLGKGFGDLSKATENCFFIDGRLTKLDWVEFHYDPSDYIRPWFFSSSDGKLGLTFTPFFERIAKTNLLVINSEVHQMFGIYRGFLITDSGKRVEIEGLTGWAEEHHARW